MSSPQEFMRKIVGISESTGFVHAGYTIYTFSDRSFDFLLKWIQEINNLISFGLTEAELRVIAYALQARQMSQSYKINFETDFEALLSIFKSLYINLIG